MHPTTPPGDGSAANAGALAELNAGLAALGQQESPQAVDGRVRALVDAITADAGVDRGSAPRGPAPLPVVAHGIDADGALFGAFDPDRARAVIDDSLDAAVVQAVLRRGGLGLDAGRLAEPVGAIRARYAEADAGRPVDPADPHHQVVRDLLADRPALTRLRQLVGDPELDVPLPQAEAVTRFLDAYPRFWAVLVPRIKAIRFESRTADGRGGGVFNIDHDHVIYLSKLRATPPGAYVRLFVHETGHATFEAVLLAGHEMPCELDTDQVRELVGKTDPDTGILARKLRGYWDGMSASARIFYHAWLTLRVDRGRHLFGLDLWQDPAGHRLDPGQRRRYQADNFTEFCAEVFAQYAMGDLHPHVAAVLADHTTPADVRTAWRNAWQVLDTVAAPILGDRAR
ncbi:hypothetical protein ACFYOT_31985 [Saccharothrix saharensis]|uniref:hypothetical protein n=1 Tax=Saccharothrix saharensis TaxID=571190 RepID=UPI00368B35F9